MLAKSLDSFIESRDGVCGGKPCIAGRRIRVVDVATWHESMKMSTDEIAAEYDLSPQEIYAALAYYYEHREEIDAQLARDDAFVADMKQRFPSQLAAKRDQRDP